MTDEEIFEKLRPLIAEVTGARPEQVRPESVLLEDLGAESIDLVDLSFLIEENFGVGIEPNEFERRARTLLTGGQYEVDGRLTDGAVEELRKLLPEVDPGKLAPGIRKADLPSLLTVSVFVHLIRRKLEERAGKEAPTCS